MILGRLTTEIIAKLLFIELMTTTKYLPEKIHLTWVIHKNSKKNVKVITIFKRIKFRENFEWNDANLKNASSETLIFPVIYFLNMPKIRNWRRNKKLDGDDSVRFERSNAIFLNESWNRGARFSHSSWVFPKDEWYKVWIMGPTLYLK